MFLIVCLVGMVGVISRVLMHVHYYTCTNVVLHVGVCGYAHCCGCMVNGSITKVDF